MEVQSPRYLQLSIEEGVVNEERVALRRKIAELETSEMRNISGKFKKTSEGIWVVNNQHPWVHAVNECAKRVQELFQIFQDKSELSGVEELQEFQEVIQWKTKVSSWKTEILNCRFQEITNDGKSRLTYIGAVALIGVFGTALAVAVFLD